MRFARSFPMPRLPRILSLVFLGETEDDFQATLDVVEKARFSSAFTFQYSPRPGTPAAEYDNQVPKDVVQERYNRLLELQERICEEENAKFVGQVVELLVQADGGRKNNKTRRLSGAPVMVVWCTSRQFRHWVSPLWVMLWLLMGAFGLAMSSRSR